MPSRMMLMDEREIDGQAARALRAALEMAPDNARALWYGGIVAYRRGDMALAQQRWVELQDHDPCRRTCGRCSPSGWPNSSNRRASRRREAGTAAPAGAIDTDRRHRSGTRRPRACECHAVRDRAPRRRSARRSRCSAVPSAPGRVSLRLSDTDAMLPGIPLAGAGPLRLIARISLSGQPHRGQRRPVRRGRL